LNFGADNVATVTNPLGGTNQDTHQDGMRLSAHKDAAGKTATFAYDEAGRRTTITDRMGDTTKIAYHAPSGKIASISNARGETITYTYAPQEQAIGPDKIPFTFYNLARVDYPDKTTAQFTYDAAGNVLTRVDRAGQPWKYTYNARGQVLTITNPAGPALSGVEGGIVTYTYNDDATLASRKDADTGETKYGYDALKRLNKITDAVGQVVNLSYDANDRITAYTDANGKTTKYEYDPNGNLTKVTDYAGNSFAYSYDAMDRVVKITDRLGKSSTFEYDKLGRVVSVTDAVGQVVNLSYDARGWLNQITRGGESLKIGYDDEGVATSFTTPLGNGSQTQRDKLGLLVGATNALNQTATLTRDSLSRITGVTDALNRATNYAYDARGLLAGVTLPEVGAAKYDYDALGNLTRIADLNGAEWKFAYTAMGRLQSQTDPLGQTTKLSYDARGRLAQVAFADGVTRALTYDAASNLTRALYSDGTDLKYAYDALNRLIEANGVQLTRDAEGRITNSQFPTPNSQSPDFGATYDDAGRIKTVSYGSGLTVTYAYDTKTGLLTQVSDSLTKTQYDFTYDKDRQLVGIARSNKVNTTLTWDKAGRLTGIKDGNVVDTQYTLDAAGQVTQARITAPLDPSAALVGQIANLSYDAASQISSANYKYDARGRITQSPNHQFAWNGASKLVGYQSTVTSQQSSVMLTYNGLGDVETRKEGDKVTRYAYNYALGLAPIVAELTSPAPPSTPAPLRYYIWSPSGVLLYMIEMDGDKPRPYHFHFDRTGSTLALTDANGKVTDAYAYDPYGKLLAHEGKSAQPFTFVGRWGVRQEGASGALYQMRARYYDATTARFLSREPLWPQIADVKEVNPYLYARNNPLSGVDPTGLDFLDELWKFNLDNSEYEFEVPGYPGRGGVVAVLMRLLWLPGLSDLLGGGGAVAGNRETPNKAMQFFQTVAQAAFPAPPPNSSTNWQPWCVPWPTCTGLVHNFEPVAKEPVLESINISSPEQASAYFRKLFGEPVAEERVFESINISSPEQASAYFRKLFGEPVAEERVLKASTSRAPNRLPPTSENFSEGNP
jgi:RHS repeat-associated protein